MWYLQIIDFSWVRRENAADKEDFQTLCSQFVCPVACQLLYLSLGGLVIHIVSGVSSLMQGLEACVLGLLFEMELIEYAF